jgi:hypothetical protein
MAQRPLGALKIRHFVLIFNGSWLAPTAVWRKFPNLAYELHYTSPSFRRKPESIVVGAEIFSNSTIWEVRKMD